MESAACGLAAGINAARIYKGQKTFAFPVETALGGLLNYICTPSADFQPMNVTFGLLPPAQTRFKSKLQKNEYLANRALQSMRDFIEKM